jgi:hypothetical protein
MNNEHREAKARFKLCFKEKRNDRTCTLAQNRASSCRQLGQRLAVTTFETPRQLLIILT